MPHREIGANPVDKVVFKCSLDELVEEIRGDQLIDICTGEVHRERLRSGEYLELHVGYATLLLHLV